MTAKACKTAQRHERRRATSEKTLATVLPAVLDDGCSYHVISHGDIDALSFLAHILAVQPLDDVLISTWVMALPDVVQLERWLDAGKLRRLDFVFGEHILASYGEVFEAAKSLAVYTGGQAKIARNHAKIILGRASGYFVAIESSANVNTNPRIEQTAIHRSEDLFWFYWDFFDGIQSIHGTNHAGRVRPPAKRHAPGRQ